MKAKLRYSIFCVTSLFVISSSQAALIDINGYLAPSTLTDGEWGDYSTVPVPATDIDPATDDDGTVLLTVATSGIQVWNTAGNVYHTGEEWNLSSGSNATTAATAFSSDSYISIALDSTGNSSELFSWDSLSASLWRNGSGADDTYQFAIDANNNGFDPGDLVGTASVLTMTGSTNAETITYTGPPLPDSTTSATVRLYHWGSSNPAGNFHLYDVSANYSLTAIPEPSTFFALFAVGGALVMFVRRRRPLPSA